MHEQAKVKLWEAVNAYAEAVSHQQFHGLAEPTNERMDAVVQVEKAIEQIEHDALIEQVRPRDMPSGDGVKDRMWETINKYAEVRGYSFPNPSLQQATLNVEQAVLNVVHAVIAHMTREGLVDDPELDCTPYQSNAFSRGERMGVEMAVQRLEDAFDGVDRGEGIVAHPGLEAARRKFIRVNTDLQTVLKLVKEHASSLEANNKALQEMVSKP